MGISLGVVFGAQSYIFGYGRIALTYCFFCFLSDVFPSMGGVQCFCKSIYCVSRCFNFANKDDFHSCFYVAGGIMDFIRLHKTILSPMNINVLNVITRKIQTDFARSTA